MMYRNSFDAYVRGNKVVKQRKYGELIKNIFVFAIGALGSKFTMFFLVPLYTNVLSDVEYGIADLVFTVGQLLVPVISLAIFNGLLRYGLEPEQHREDVWKCASIIFILGSVIMIMITPLISLYKPISKWSWYVCIYTILCFFSQNVFVYLKVKEKNIWYSVLNICQALLLVLCNCVFLIKFKLGIQGYLLSSLISTGITALLATFIGGTIKDLSIARYDKCLMKKMVYYSIPFIFNDISWWIIRSSDKVMIEWIIGGTYLGLYTAASKIPSFVTVFTSIFSQAWVLSSIKEYDSTNDTNFYSEVFQFFSVVIFGVCIFVIALIKPFMSIYVGDKFFEAWKYVPLLIVSAAFAAVVSFTSSLYGAMKKSKNIMSTTLIAGGINVIINYIFINLCGVWGALVGTVIAYSVVAVLRLLDIRRYININYNLPMFFGLTGLIMAEAILVSLDLHIIEVSLITILLYLLLTKKQLSQMVKMVLLKLKKH